MTDIDEKELFKVYTEIARKYKFLDLEHLIEDFKKLKRENHELRIENAILKENLLSKSSVEER